MNPVYDHLFNILLIGETKTGKSNIFFRTNNAPKYKWKSVLGQTIGVEFSITYQSIGNKNCRLHLWDTSGQERFRQITSSYYRGAHGILLIYDITNRESFENLGIWIENAKRFTSEETVFVLLGNCCDMEEDRQVSYEEGRIFAQMHGIPFFEVSAKTTENIKYVVKIITRNIIFRSDGIKQQANDLNKVILQKESEQKKEEGSKKCYY